MDTSNERVERKLYRKSPGRQYGYNYDPLQNDNGQQREDTTQVGQPRKMSTQLAQRPNLKRTRELTRKHILASKRASQEISQREERPENEEIYVSPTRREVVEDQEDPTFYSSRRQRAVAAPRTPSTRELEEMTDEDYEDYSEDAYYDEYKGQDAHDSRRSREVYVDPDQGEDYDVDPLEARLGHAPAPASRQIQPVARTRQLEVEPEYEDDYEDEYEEDKRPRRKRKKVSRRGLLFGIGALAVGGASVAAYELAPKIPGVVSGAAGNVEQQLEDAFNKGLAQGADNARKEIITSLQNLEGFTLDGAISAAKLTRVAYDVFVSPVVKVGAVIAGDFLTTMLQAVTTARSWLKNAYLDNGTLQAVQTILQSWVDQVNTLPQQLDAITDTDLDGAQSYLNALVAKIKSEQAQLQSSATPTAATKTTPTATTPKK